MEHLLSLPIVSVSIVYVTANQKGLPTANVTDIFLSLTAISAGILPETADIMVMIYT